MLEVFGTGFNDDIDRVKYNQRQNLTHEQQAIEEMTAINEYFHQVKASVSSKTSDIFGEHASLRGHYEVLIDMIIEGFSEMIRILKNRPQKTDFEIKSHGHLVLMTCGHRGRPSRQEEKRISRLLRKSTFIPMLEEIYGISN